MEDTWITSVGIDLGTSTTKLIVSRLRIVLTSPHFSLPHYQIVERRLVYSSPIYRTPLLHFDVIHLEEVAKILRFEYEQAGIEFSVIKSGAIIITGETATKQNAAQIIHYLAERAGDFVVATAGADLEGILAGKGSGAQDRSMETDRIIANIDIGGGTANVVLFKRGKVIDTVTFHVGGKLLEVTDTGVIQRISPPLSQWLKAKNCSMKASDVVTFQQLTDLCCEMIRTIFSHLTGKQTTELLLGKPLKQVYPIDEVMISGGIGQLLGEQAPRQLSQAAEYGDIGPLLAATVQMVSPEYPFSVDQALHTQHATVIGAGMQTTEVSGGTVFADAALLPLRNVPVMKLAVPKDPSSNQWPMKIKKEFAHVMHEGEKWVHEQKETSLAFALSGLRHVSYQTVSQLADEFAFYFSKRFAELQTMVVICEVDMAKALGQAIALRCRDRPRVICIDQVFVKHGDYIDLGEPLDGEMIPVVIKTLVFPKRQVR